MKIKSEEIKCVGRIMVFKNGILVVDKSNLIVDGGKDAIARAICGVAQPSGSTLYFTHIQIGTSDTAPNSGQTALVTPITTDPPIQAPTAPEQPGEGLATTSFISPKQAQWEFTFTATGTVTVKETGLFNGRRALNPPPIMLARQIFSTSLNAPDTLRIVWTISVV